MASSDRIGAARVDRAGIFSSMPVATYGEEGT